MTIYSKLQLRLLNARVYRYFIYAYLVLGVAVIALMTWYFRHGLVIPIGTSILLFAPVIFKKQFRRPFNKQCIVEFDSSGFAIQVTGKEVNKVIKHSYHSIDYYRIVDGVDESFLGLYLSNGQHQSYNFDYPVSGNDDTITDVFSAFIQEYNHSAEIHKIRIKATFLTSSTGTIVLTILGFGWLILLGHLFVSKPKTLPYGMFGGLFLFLQVMILRKREADAIKNQL